MKMLLISCLLLLSAHSFGASEEFIGHVVAVRRTYTIELDKLFTPSNCKRTSEASPACYVVEIEDQKVQKVLLNSYMKTDCEGQQISGYYVPSFSLHLMSNGTGYGIYASIDKRSIDFLGEERVFQWMKECAKPADWEGKKVITNVHTAK